MTATAALDAPAAPPRSGLIVNAAIVIVVGVLATTLAQPQALARLPLQNMMKNELHVSRSLNAAFFFLAGLPWYFKPFAGVLTDAFPIAGTRRRSYLLISGVLATLAWVALYFTPHAYNPLLWMCIGLSLFMMTASTVIGAFMVEIAQATGGSGRLTAIRQAGQMVVTFIQGPAAGYLASIAFGWTCVACGAAMFLIVPVAFIFLREQRRRVDSQAMLAGAGEKLVTIGRAMPMWAAAGVTAVVFLAPGVGTALFYRQQDLLHMTPNSGPGLPGFLGGQGFLSVIAALAGLGAAAIYAWLCRRRDFRTMLALCLVAGALSGVGLLFYNSAAIARVMAAVGGFGGTLVELALMDLAIRATPPGAEGMGFSLLMSARNICLLGADFVGSALLDNHMLSFNQVVVAGMAVTLLAAPLTLLLPRRLTRRKDAEVLEEYPEPASVIQEP